MAKEIISGIYKIYNKTTEKFYIGSSNNIHRRWREHIRNLNSNTHANKHLQCAWNKYGENDFVFSVLEICDIENLREREQYYIDFTNCCNREIGYNIAIKTDMTEISEETKQKISNTLKGKYFGENCFYSKYTEELIKNIINDLMDVNKSFNYIAEKYKVNKSLICGIVYKDSWTYLTKNLVFPSRDICKIHTKLNSTEVEEIVQLLIDGYSDAEIGSIYNINRKTISDIRNHKTWIRYTDGIIFPKSKGYLNGVKNNKNKLSIEQVKDIKNRLNLNESLSSIAKIYNVSPTNIMNIRNGKVYKYV